MMNPVALEHASRLVNHGPTVLVSTAHEGRRNVMAAAWSMPVEFTPPRIAVVIDKQTLTHELLMASGHFALGLPTPALADFSYAVGTRSGREGDKFRQLGLEPDTRNPLELPLVPGCSAWLLLRRIPEPHSESAYDTVFGEVLWAAADARIFANGRWDFRDDNADLHTLHHLGAGQFVVPSRVVQAKG
ncbi:MAG: flavin reductase family protein [Burkholderiales bacterium]|uniref:flavin reductase family protein n=1 Tax=Inhella sp. TaxID=1921806 RepID=UPI001AD354A9|nr:flavin reductase family protein [Burkholderiales bacterium]